MKILIDIHRHTIGIKHCAKYIFGKFSAWIMNNPEKRLHILEITLKIGGILIPGRDRLERFSRFMKHLEMTTEDKIKEGLQEASLLCIYTIDMENCQGGDVEISYEDQIEELIRLKNEGYQILIFMHLDNNRPNLLKFAAKYASHVYGWKLYPPLSGYPTDQCIKDVLDTFPKPVVVHCTDTSPIYFQGKVNLPGRNQKERCQNFGKPIYIFKLADMYPHINFSFCHGGGSNPEMREEVIRYCRILPNCYMDNAYEDNAKYFEEAFERIPNKILFGSDKTMCDFFTLSHMQKLQENNVKFLGL